MPDQQPNTQSTTDESTQPTDQSDATQSTTADTPTRDTTADTPTQGAFDATETTDAVTAATGGITADRRIADTNGAATDTTSESAATDTTSESAATDTMSETDTGSSEATEGTTADEPETGATAVVAALERAGVDHLFGVQGGAIMPVYDALADGDATHVTMAHEQGAAHAADAYGQVTGTPGVCLATSGPGATNLITGLADAAMDSDPLVALTGQVPTDLLGKDAFQETDTVGVTTPVTTANHLVTDPNEAGVTVTEAFRRASTGRPGPTLVDLPKDVTQAETDRPTTETDGPKRNNPATDRPTENGSDQIPTPDETAIRASASAIERAERPLLLAGGGVVKGEACEEVRSFATSHGIPVTTTMPGIGSFPEDHELALSWAGMHGTGYANAAISHCDLLIAVGTRFDDRLTGDVSTFAPEAEVIHVDVDPSEISKNVYADYPVVGDAAIALSAIDETMEESPTTDAWREQCATWRDEYPMTYAAPDDRPVKPQFVVEAVDAATPEETIVTTGVGQHQMWAAQYWTFTEPRTFVSSNGLGTMGYGLPAAIGARVAAPERTVVAFEGDGSFLMTCQELAVAVREHLDITVFVLNNEAVGMVRQWQDAFYEGRHTASEYPWVPKFDALAEAFGATGFQITSYDEVAETVTEALATDGPAVVDVHIDPEENVYPMVPSGGRNDAFALREEHL